MAEDLATARKRLAMRAWRRGTKEMDLVMGPYADAHLAGMGAEEIAAFDALLSENDQDLMAWVIGQLPAPGDHADLLARIAADARTRRTASN
jgi:antitoxin CptB